MQTEVDHTPPTKQARAFEVAARRALTWLRSATRRRPVKLGLAIAGGVVAVALVALIAVNLIISADWVRDRVAARIKEQTGRDLTVNGSTVLLFTPGPHIVLNDATLTDPQARAGTADVAIGKLTLDLNFGDLLSRRIDPERIVLIRPVLTLRLGSDAVPERRSDAGGSPKPIRFAKAAAGGEDGAPQRDIKLKDVRIEDGAVNFVSKDGKEKRVERISAQVSLPNIDRPLTALGKFDWKQQTVDFSLELATPADLREERPARLQIALDNAALAARFDGSVLTKPNFSGEGELSAKVHSIPSLIAWMREAPPADAAIGDGELASRISWKQGEVTVSDARFALEHASGQGQAVVTLDNPRPHIRAAFALDHLDLNPFLAAKSAQGASIAPKAAAQPAPLEVPPQSEAATPAKKAAARDWFKKPEAAQQEWEAVKTPSATEAAPAPPTPDTGPSAEIEIVPPAAPQTSSTAAQSAPDASPASFDADVNMNVRKTRVGHLDIGPSSLALNFRNGLLNATLGGMDLYDGHASGKLVLDATRSVPAFTGDFQLDGVEAKSLLSDAAQFSLLSGRAKLALKLSGAGTAAEEIKSSLQGQGSIAVSDGSIEGIDITAFITQIGQGNIPDFQQRPGAKTEFSDLGGSFVIENGIVETNNLKMQSPLLKVGAAGTVDLPASTLNILAHPEVVAGPAGVGGANELAGLTIPVRIEGPFEDPRIKPEIKGAFASPEKTSKTLNQIGEVLQKKFKGKPVGEALGRILGGIQIGPRGGEESEQAEDGGAQEPPIIKKRSAPPRQAQPAPQSGDTEQGDSNEPEDPDLEEILR
jgi:AsmA protein